MLIKPRFRQHGYLKAVEPDTLFFLTASGVSQLQSPLYFRLASLIDGSRTVNEIAAVLKQDFKPVEILGAVNNLHKVGLIEDSSANSILPSEQLNAWHGLNIEPGKLAQARVAIHCLGSVDAGGFAQLLESMSIPVVIPGAVDTTFDVVLVDDYLRPELAPFNKQAQRPWMLLRPTTTPLLIGPIFQPGKTACYACLEQRLQLNRQVERLYAEENDVFPPYPAAYLPATAHTAFGMAALALAQWIAAPAQSALVNTVRSVQPLTLEIQQHTLVKRAQCPVCGDATKQEARAIVLLGGRKVGGNEGGFRTATPAETIARYEHHVSPITGIAPQLRLLPNKGLAYTYVTGAPLSRNSINWHYARQITHSAASGKGVTELQAKVSGLCEAIERYSGVFEGYEPRIDALYAELDGKAIHPANLLHFSDRQYDAREERNLSAHNMKQIVPMRFDESRRTEWTPVWSLTTSDWKYIPTAFNYYNYPQPNDYVFCYGDSNGNAAGSSLEDAIFQGLLELVERDAAAIWWFNRIQRPGIDLEGIDDSYMAQLRDYYRSIQREFWVLDLTVDLNIPVFGAVTRRTEGEYEVPVCGFGAHLDPKIALMRALSEMNQLLDPAKTLLLPEDHHTMTGTSVSQTPCLLPDPAMPLRKLDHYPYHRTDELLDDLNQCRGILDAHGLELLVLDQTRPDLGLPVVKVIVPGLRHFWPRFGPGRLYDVPVQLGWRNAPLREEELNPLAISG
jgi:bacteriocin biosynthesis cyclodehydratase domain-containing protein